MSDQDRRAVKKLIGTPANGTVSADIAAIQAAIVANTVDLALVYKGICDAGMSASTTTIVSASFKSLGDDLLNGKYWATVIKNANSVGNAPEQEYRKVTDYTSVSGTVVCDAFSANVEENDIVLLLHESVIDGRQQVACFATATNTLTDTYSDVVNISGRGYITGLYYCGRSTDVNGLASYYTLTIDGVAVINGKQLAKSDQNVWISGSVPMRYRFSTSLRVQHKSGYENSYLLTLVTYTTD